MMEILIDFIIGIASGLTASAVYDAIKNKKNGRPKPEKLDDDHFLK